MKNAIKITEQLTKENYHSIFSTADAKRKSLKEVIEVNGYLDLYGCTSLRSLPDNLNVKGYMYLDDCISLRSLPDNLNVGGGLNLSGCLLLTSLPDNLNVKGYIYVDKAQVNEFKKMAHG